MNFTVVKKTLFTLLLANALGSVPYLDSVAVAQTPPVDATFKIGDVVTVVSTTDYVSVRSIASITGSSILANEPAGAKGMIVGAPLSDINGSSTVIFYQVTFSDGISGWAAGKYLTKDVVITIPPPVVNPCDSAFQRGLATRPLIHDTTTIHDTVRTVCPPLDSLAIKIKGALLPFLK